MSDAATPDAYVMKACATCVHFVQIEPKGIFKHVGECQNIRVPAKVVLMTPMATQWGCILHTPRLPVIDITPVD